MNGILDLSVWQTLLVLFAMAHVTLLAVTVYLHRFSAHRALDLHPVLQHFFRFWLWLTTGMSTKAWTAIHRKHHAKCETSEDPHSPVVLGLKTVLLRGAELYKQSSTKEVLEKYGKGTPDDLIERRLYRPFPSMGIALMFGLDLLLFGVSGVWVWALQMLTVPMLAAGVINGLGHHFGYRNFSCPDASTNISPFGFLILGEELHNNHHAHPTAAKFSMRKWEFDMGWAWIQLFRVLGLAKVNRDSSTKGANQQSLLLGRNRFRVLLEYTRKVLLPVYKAERKSVDKSCRISFRRVRRMLKMQACQLDTQKKMKLKEVLDYSPVLATLYEMRSELTRIFSIPGDFTQPLRDWCRRAEQSGLALLREYAANLQRLLNHNQARSGTAA